MATITITEASRKIIKDYYDTANNSTINIIGGGSSTPIVDITKSYVDGSLAVRDLSINFAFLKNVIQDASIIELRTKNTNQDTSIAWLDASTRKLFTQNATQDASLIRHEASIGNIINGTTTFKGAKTFSNQIISDNGVKSSNFIPGILGQGYTCGSTAQFENLTITNDLNVRTLRNNIITAENGTRILNQSVTAVDTSTEGAGINHDANGYYFNVESWLNSMQIGFPIVSQSQSVSGIETLEYVVTDISNGRVYVNITDSSTQTTPVSSIANVNIGTFSYVFPPGFYSIQATGDGQYCKTPDFHAPADSSVYITFTNTAINFGTMSVALYTKDGSLYNTLWSAATSVIGTRGANITEDVSLHTRFILTSSGHNVNLYAPSQRVVTYIAAETPNVKGRTFVRKDGNPVIETAVLPWAPGTRWLKDTSDALNHTQDDILAAIGNLQGIRFNDVSVYEGNYIPQAYIEGDVVCNNLIANNSGSIAGINITRGGLISGNINGERMQITTPDASSIMGIYFYDSSANNVVSLSNKLNYGGVSGLSAYTYVSGTDACTYTFKSDSTNTKGYTSSTPTYISWRNGTTKTQLLRGALAPVDGSCFEIYNNLFYTCVLEFALDVSCVLPAPYVENPGPNRIEHTFTQTGYWSPTTIEGATIDVSIFNADDSVIGSLYGFGTLYYINDLSPKLLIYSNIFPSNINNLMYLKHNFQIYNNVTRTETIKTYGNDNLVYTQVINTTPTITVNSLVNRFYLKANQTITEIGRNYITSYKNNDAYFAYSQDYGGDNGSLSLKATYNYNKLQEQVNDIDEIDVSTTSYKLYRGGAPLLNEGLLNVGENTPGAFAATFRHDGNTANSYGIKIQAGEDTPSTVNIYIDFKDGNGSTIGSIYKNGGSAIALGVPSDKKLKTDIEDSSIYATDIVDNIRVASFKMIKSSEKPTIGFIADEVEKVYPEMVVNSTDGNKMIGITQLIPIHHKDLQEIHLVLRQQQKEINELKASLDNIQKVIRYDACTGNYLKN